jgi:hypothetical protein
VIVGCPQRGRITFRPVQHVEEQLAEPRRRVYETCVNRLAAQRIVCEESDGEGDDESTTASACIKERQPKPALRPRLRRVLSSGRPT